MCGEEFDSFCCRFTTMSLSDWAWWLPYCEPCVSGQSPASALEPWGQTKSLGTRRQYSQATVNNVLPVMTGCPAFLTRPPSDDQAPVYEIYRLPIFKWVAASWLEKLGHLHSSPRNGHQGDMLYSTPPHKNDRCRRHRHMTTVWQHQQGGFNNTHSNLALPHHWEIPGAQIT